MVHTSRNEARERRKSKCDVEGELRCLFSGQTVISHLGHPTSAMKAEEGGQAGRGRGRGRQRREWKGCRSEEDRPLCEVTLKRQGDTNRVKRRYSISRYSIYSIQIHYNLHYISTADLYYSVT